MTSTEKIENPKTELSNKATMNDEDILSATLATEKNLCNSYTKAMVNASYGKFHSLLSDMFKDTSQQYRKLFDLQFQHGWCSLIPASPTEITATEQKFNELKERLK